MIFFTTVQKHMAEVLAGLLWCYVIRSDVDIYKDRGRYRGQASKCPGHCVNTADCLGHPCYLKVVSIINKEGHTSPLGVNGQLRG